MKIQKIVLAAVILSSACGARAAGTAGYDYSGVSEYMVSLAKRKNFHIGIEQRALKSGVKQADFARFYLEEAGKRLALEDKEYIAAQREVEFSAPLALTKFSAAARNSRRAQDYAFRGMAEAASGQHEAAIASFDAAIKLEPSGHDGVLYQFRGAAKYRMGDAQSALDDFAKSLDIAPGNPAILQARSGIYFERRDYARSAEDLSGFFRNSLDAVESRKVSQSLLCEALAYNGFAVKGCADLQADAEKYIAASSTVPVQKEFAAVEKELKADAAGEGAADPASKALFYAEYAAKAVRTSKPVSPARLLTIAKMLADKEIALSPSAEAYSRRAILKYRLADYRMMPYTEALADYDKAIELNPRGSAGWDFKMRADIRMKYGDTQNALNDMDKALEINPQNSRFRLARAAVMIALSLPVDAQSDMIAFFRLEGNTTDAQAVARGPECRILAANGYLAGMCRPLSYFEKNDAAADPVSYPPQRTSFVPRKAKR